MSSKMYTQKTVYPAHTFRYFWQTKCKGETTTTKNNVVIDVKNLSVAWIKRHTKKTNGNADLLFHFSIEEAINLELDSALFRMLNNYWRIDYTFQAINILTVIWRVYIDMWTVRFFSHWINWDTEHWERCEYKTQYLRHF